MNAPTKLLLTLTAAAALSFAHTAKANLITNPGFETGDFTGWTTGGTGLTPLVTGQALGVSPHSGNFQAFFQAGATTLSQSVATTSGASYTIDFFLAAANQTINTTRSFSVIWGGVTLFGLTNPSPFPYTEYTFNVTGSPGSTTVLFQFNHFNSEGGVWFLDDVSVNPSTVPDGGSTVSLLGCSLLGLVALRRKLSC